MAIPIFTPDDGPTPPAPVANPSAAAPPSALNSGNGSGTFLNQLVLELYSTYYDYCQIQSVAAVNSRNQSSSGSGGQVLFPAPVPQLPPPQFQPPSHPIEDVNNNFYPTNANENHGLGIASSGSRRRRRHPAGRAGFPDTNRAATDADLVPLSVQLNLESGHDPANTTTTLTELELKLSVAENLGVGVSLRHIADSYQSRNSCCPVRQHEKTSTPKQKLAKTITTFSIDVDVSLPSLWPGKNPASSLLFVLGSAFLTTSAAVAYFRWRRA